MVKLLTDNEKILVNALSIHRTQKTGFHVQCERVLKYGITKNLVQCALNQIEKRKIYNKNHGIDCNFDTKIDEVKSLKTID